LPGSKFALPEEVPFVVRIGLGALFFGSFVWSLWLLFGGFVPAGMAEFASVGEYAFTLLFWATVGVVWVFVTQSLLANLLRQLQGDGFASELPAAAAAGAFSALYFFDTLHWLVVGAAAVLSFGVGVGFRRSRTAATLAFWAFAAPACAWVALHLGTQIVDSLYRDLFAGAGI